MIPENSPSISSYENKQKHISDLKTPNIETWMFQYPNSQTEIVITIPEFTCICPKTTLPDFATIIIRYLPKEKCLELKSLKEYILFFRNIGIFHEHLVNKVLLDCVATSDPVWMEIEGVFNARGGIQTTAVATHGKKI